MNSRRTSGDVKPPGGHAAALVNRPLRGAREAEETLAEGPEKRKHDRNTVGTAGADGWENVALTGW